MKRNFVFAVILLVLVGCTTEKSTMERILSNGSESFRLVLQDPGHEVQIIYGEISGDSIIHHSYGVDHSRYFYPASTIKMPVAFAALKKAQEEGISIDDYLVIDSTEVYPRSLAYDSIFTDSITIRNLTNLIFTVSDNAASNILYGWMGKDYLNELYGSMGVDTRIVHQLGEGAFSFSPISNRYSRQTRFFQQDRQIAFYKEQPQSFEPGFEPGDQQKGVGFIDSLGILLEQPFDFSKKNFVPLRSLIEILEMGVRPDLMPKTKQLGLANEYQQVALVAMDLLPRELPPPYDTLPDNYVKFLQFGSDENGELPTTMKVWNKVGWAYGYLLDIAYFQDSESDVQFFLAAMIHVNENRIYNDGVYEYESVGLPFLDELGDLVYAHEVSK